MILAASNHRSAPLRHVQSDGDLLPLFFTRRSHQARDAHPAETHEHRGMGRRSQAGDGGECHSALCLSTLCFCFSQIVHLSVHKLTLSVLLSLPGHTMQLHDELMFEVQSSRLHEVAALVKHVMEGAWKLRVPTPMEAKVGRSWGALQPFEI